MSEQVRLLRAFAQVLKARARRCQEKGNDADTDRQQNIYLTTGLTLAHLSGGCLEAALLLENDAQERRDKVGQQPREIIERNEGMN